jgi:hypothetical protein
MTLVECIGVLAILAVIAGLMLPVMLRHLDGLASEVETATLKKLGDALQDSIRRNHYIPTYTNWASVVAAEAGMDIGTVTNNARSRLRVCWIDSSGWLSTNLPYTQTYTGTTNLPANARIMLVSSVGRNLPISSAMPNATDFSDLWNTPEGTIPSSGPWVGWTSSPKDVKIQRVNLSPLFFNMVLSTYTGSTNGQYAVDGGALYPVPRGAGMASYFLQGTLLTLYSGSPSNTLASTQLISQDTSLVYESGVWKSSIVGTVTLGVGDISGIVAAFLQAIPNTNAAAGQQQLVVTRMIDYMSNYNRWATGPSPAASFSDNGLRNYLKNTVQPNMMAAIQGLYATPKPTNGMPCL